MFNGRLKITVIAANELQETNFMKRLQLTESAPPVQLDPYVAIDVDEVKNNLLLRIISWFASNDLFWTTKYLYITLNGLQGSFKQCYETLLKIIQMPKLNKWGLDTIVGIWIPDIQIPDIKFTDYLFVILAMTSLMIFDVFYSNQDLTSYK